MCWPFSRLRIFINSEAMYLDRAAWIKTLICSIKNWPKKLGGEGVWVRRWGMGEDCVYEFLVSSAYKTFWQYIVSFFFFKIPNLGHFSNNR